MTQERVKLIETLLREGLHPLHFEIEDESHLHRGHAGARDGGGHFRVTIVSDAFEGKSLVEQHKLVQETLKGLYGAEIHALALKTVAPSRWKK